MSASTKKKITIGIILLIGISIIILYVTAQHKNKDYSSSQITVEKNVAVNRKAPSATFATINGTQRTLSQFKGKKVMFWMVATWCSSCAAGMQTLAQNSDKLRGITIIMLKTYGDAGYPGPSITEFTQKYSPQVLSQKNWVVGNASQKMTSIYNPRNYPDIYFLIDSHGVVQTIDGSPSATINKIIQFANE